MITNLAVRARAVPRRPVPRRASCCPLRLAVQTLHNRRPSCSRRLLAAAPQPNDDRRRWRRRAVAIGTGFSVSVVVGTVTAALLLFDDSVVVMGATADEEELVGRSVGFSLEDVCLSLRAAEWIAAHQGVDNLDDIVVKVTRLVCERYSHVFVPELALALRLRAQGRDDEAEAALARAKRLMNDFPEHQGKLSYLMPTEAEWAAAGRAPSWGLLAASEPGVWVVRAHVPRAQVTSSAPSALGQNVGSVVLRLRDGSLALVNPVPLPAEALAAIRGVGKVSVVLAQHRSEEFLAALARDFPGAKIVTAEVSGGGELRVHKNAERCRFDELFDQGDLVPVPLAGGDFAELAVFHPATGSLVVADTLRVVGEAEPADPSARLSAFVAGGVPSRNRGVYVPNWILPMIDNLPRYRQSAHELAALEPRRLVTGEGSLLEADDTSSAVGSALSFVDRIGRASLAYYQARYSGKTGM